MDVDFGDTVNYTLYIDKLATFTSPIVFSAIQDTFFVVPGGLEKSTDYFWKVEAVDLSGSITESNTFYKFTTSDIATAVWYPNHGLIPQEFTLLQNYPNPFNPETTIEYMVPERERIVIKIYNLMGKEVRILVDEQNQPGHYRIIWDGRDEQGEKVASGVFIYRMRAGQFVSMKKLVLMR